VESNVTCTNSLVKLSWSLWVIHNNDVLWRLSVIVLCVFLLLWPSRQLFQSLYCAYFSYYDRAVNYSSPFHINVVSYWIFVLQITNPELPHEKLLAKFPNISGFFTVSSKTGQVSDSYECYVIADRRRICTVNITFIITYYDTDALLCECYQRLTDQEWTLHSSYYSAIIVLNAFLLNLNLLCAYSCIRSSDVQLLCEYCIRILIYYRQLHGACF